MAPNGRFTFVLIPADETSPIQTLSGDKSGGLEKDYLVQHAKAYFHNLTGAKQRAAELERASPEQRKALAAKIRQQVQESTESSSANERLKDMDDDTVVNVLYGSQVRPSCDITALTVPTPGNNYRAVSLYVAEDGRSHGFAANGRATALLTACGHAAPNGGVAGDAFVGSSHDNEASDVWERVDFTAADADPQSEWCRTARSPGGGGGSGSKAAHSLTNLVQQQGQGNMQIVDTGAMTGGASSAASLFGSNGAPPVQESWGVWTQTDEEVELKFPVEIGTKTKDIKVQFGRTKLHVTVAGKVILQGSLFDPVDPDDCTFTLQNEGASGRELCITLGKTENRTWSFAVR